MCSFALDCAEGAHLGTYVLHVWQLQSALQVQGLGALRPVWVKHSSVVCSLNLACPFPCVSVGKPQILAPISRADMY